MTDVRYRPATDAAPWHAAVSAPALAVLAPDVAADAVEAVWRGLDGAGLGELLETLTRGRSLTGVAPFALVVAEGDGVRVAVRGDVELVAERDAGTERLSGAGAATWVERLLPGIRRLDVVLPVESSAQELPVRDGVVAVSALTWTLTDAAGAPGAVGEAPGRRVSPPLPAPGGASSSTPAGPGGSAPRTGAARDPETSAETPIVGGGASPSPFPALGPEARSRISDGDPVGASSALAGGRAPGEPDRGRESARGEVAGEHADRGGVARERVDAASADLGDAAHGRADSAERAAEAEHGRRPAGGKVSGADADAGDVVRERADAARTAAGETAGERADAAGAGHGDTSAGTPGEHHGSGALGAEGPAHMGLEPEGADTWAPPAATSAPEVEAPVDEYDQLWGATIARPVQAAAIVPPAPGEAAETGRTAPVGSEEAEAGAQSAGAASTDAAAPLTTPTLLGDHDGETIAVAELRAVRDAERQKLESTDQVPPRRPSQGRIRLSTGRVVELDRPVVVGRRPRSTRASGAELPILVAVESPEQDISRSHLEVRAEGEHVLVTDLDTTNGSVLLRGGSEPVRLHPGEPTMVVSGDAVDIGDGVVLTFEDLP